MKRLFVPIALSSLSVFAQTGFFRSADGIRVPSATTLPQGHISLVASYDMVTDGKTLSAHGKFYDGLGEEHVVPEDIPSSGGIVLIGYGLFDYLQASMALPVYYDGSIEGTDAGGRAVGDLETSLKFSFPLTIPLQVAVSADLFAPIGAKSRGFRPRHVWYISEEGRSYALTAGGWSLAGNLFLSTDITKYFMLSTYAGYLKTWGEGMNTILWGAGLNILPQSMFTVSLEISGETPIMRHGDWTNPLYSPLRLTPGLRLHLPRQFDIAISLDFGLASFVHLDNDEELKIRTKKPDGSYITYTVPGSPKYSVALSVSKLLNYSMADTDKDGVIDREDLCPNTIRRAVVNARGCPVDQDQDGVMNIVDDCPDTPLGVSVDYFGCPVDQDKDGVPDYLDQCANTPIGFAVDKQGCTLDTDGDGVDDNNDRCPGTAPNDPVDEIGCPLDEDHDGVPNVNDICPNTPSGFAVDAQGCSLDDDKDGIPNEVDKCPNTEPEEIIDYQGCPADGDKDGVPDSKDLCPNTAPGATVDRTGCLADTDKDGVPDDNDKCPGTPAKAPVDDDGCASDSDGDGVFDHQDECPGTLEGVGVQKNGCPLDIRENPKILATRVHFAPGTSRLLNGSYSALNDLIYLMRKHPASVLTIKSSDEAKINAIVEYLESKGFYEDRVKKDPNGKSPIVSFSLNDKES